MPCDHFTLLIREKISPLISWPHVVSVLSIRLPTRNKVNKVTNVESERAIITNTKMLFYTSLQFQHISLADKSNKTFIAFSPAD